MRVLNKERREERRREAICSKAKEKGDNCGLHTSFNLISTEPLDHELYPEGFYLFLYNHFFFMDCKKVVVGKALASQSDSCSNNLLEK